MVPTLRVQHAPASAALVRDRIAESLRGAGISAADVFDATIVASELLANAIRHAPSLPSGELQVEWALTGPRFEVSVTDGGAVEELVPPTVQPWEISGRGLSIVEAIADDWGLRAGAGHTTVWAVGTLPSATAGATIGDVLSNR